MLLLWGHLASPDSPFFLCAPPTAVATRDDVGIGGWAGFSDVLYHHFLATSKLSGFFLTY